MGNANANPILDSREYAVHFEDREVTELTANVIDESMYAQWDPGGNQYVLFYCFVDFWKEDITLTTANQKIVVQGRVSLCRSIVGWQLCCQWKDGSTSWEKLSDLKESHPLQTTEYAITQGIDHEPAFNWWILHVLKKREQIISLVKKRSA